MTQTQLNAALNSNRRALRKLSGAWARIATFPIVDLGGEPTEAEREISRAAAALLCRASDSLRNERRRLLWLRRGGPALWRGGLSTSNTAGAR